MIPKKVERWCVERWCEQNGWTEPFFKEGKYYAFSPNAVIPQPIPVWWNETDAYERLVDYFCYMVFPSLLLILFLVPCIFLWQWRGIWSVYISQSEKQKFLACHYCPITTGILVEMKSSSQGLAEVKSIILSKPAKLVVINHSGSENMAKLVSQEEVKGRILFIFPHE